MLYCNMVVIHMKIDHLYVTIMLKSMYLLVLWESYCIAGFLKENILWITTIQNLKGRRGDRTVNNATLANFKMENFHG